MTAVQAPRAPGGFVTAGFVAACATGVAVSWNLTGTGAVAGLLAEHYGVGLGTVGLLVSVTFFGQLLGMIPGGRAIDRWGARRIAVVALALCAGGNALLAILPAVPAALALRALVGLGIAAGFLAGAVWIQGQTRGDALLAQGVFGGAALAGAGLATAVVPAFSDALAWRSPYVTGLVVAAVALTIAARAPAVPVAGARSETTPVHRLLTNGTLARLGAVQTATFAFSVVIANWIVTLLTRNAGYTLEAAGAVGALTLVLGVVARPLGGWLARRRPERTYAVVVIGLVLAAVGAGLLALSTSRVVDALAAAAVGLGAGLPFGPTLNAAARTLPRAPGEAIAAVNLYAVAAMLVGTELVGLTFWLPGGGRIGFAALAVLMLAAVAAVSPRLFVAGPRA